jgi:hypothetical protein
MEHTEKRFLPSTTLFSIQTDINEKMRGILVNWLVDVHFKFKLLAETLYLTINLIDRFTERQDISRLNYQLVGITAMLIASKYEEIYAPEIKDFLFITDNAYNKEQILKMERNMLRTLDFDITVPSMFRFLERYAKIANCDDLIFNFSRFLLEMTLPVVQMYKHKPSLLACSAIYFSNKVMNRPQPWNEVLGS